MNLLFNDKNVFIRIRVEEKVLKYWNNDLTHILCLLEMLYFKSITIALLAKMDFISKDKIMVGNYLQTKDKVIKKRGVMYRLVNIL